MSNFEIQSPEQTARVIMNRSFLKGRDSMRETGEGSRYFQNNRIRSCSYIKDTKSGSKAVPFYDKRDNREYPTKSTVIDSWNKKTFNNSAALSAGMGIAKPLSAYHPQSARNSMYIENFRPPYRNSSHIEIGQRSKRDTKHFLSTYRNDMIQKNWNEVPTNHPGIQAYRNKWLRSRLAL